MQHWLAAVAPKALNITSTKRCEVSTLPAHTAASLDGLSIDPGGTSMVIGLMQP